MSADESTKNSGPSEPWEEEECLLCVPANHPNCEMYTTLGVIDHSTVPLDESDADHEFQIPVCAGHYEAIKQFQRGRVVAEVEAP